MKRVPTFIIIVSALVAAGAPGQPHPYEHISPDQTRTRHEPFTCSVRADIITLPPAIRFRMDVTIVNDRDAPMASLAFLLPPPSSSLLVLDSISYRGVPLDSSAFEMVGESLLVRLGTPLPPGQTALLHFAAMYGPIQALDDGAVVLAHWLPLPQAARNDSIPPADDTVAYRAMRYNLAVTCDSALRVIAPGMLVNANMQYGLLPHGEGVFTDVTKHMLAADAESPYTPDFENGRRTFVFRISSASKLPLIVSPSFRFDRVITDRVTADVFYSPAADSVQASKFSNALFEQLIRRPFDSLSADRELTIYADPEADDDAYDQLLILNFAAPLSDSTAAFVRTNFEKASRPAF